ncbi:PREDICTED: probable G-protein coupled receptor 158 [Priapulus caudatus]|uniref:Probable G-protein coupled receptor 158 n=1 Tax=Priapulus caudatus TaxID=37621 RepID=A0ABM1E0F3_PRICU|nr:PREDICTED: probable G-protein coupled receptor 158 [Priapulus caudatus]
MITYSIPFYKWPIGRERRVFAAWGVATIDVNLNHVDINQCPAPHALKHRDDPFIGTHRCHSLSTKCEPVAGRGFRSGGYRCSCRKGFYSNLVEIDPETNVETPFKAFDGYQIEKEFAKSKRKLDNTYDSLTCLKCQPHCDECVDDTPCLSWISRKLMLAFCIIVGICWLLALIFLIMIWMKRNNVVIKISNVIILSLIIIGACMMLAEVILASYEPTKKLCHASIWMYTEGFVLAYTALIVKAYREVTVCRSGYIGKARANDKWHYLVIAIAVIVFTIFMAICTARAPILPQVFVQSADHKYLMCDHSWWAWTVTIVEYLLVFFAGVAISLHTVAKRVTYLEPRFISRLLIIFPIILLCIFIIGALNRGQWYVHANYVIIFAKVMVAATLMLICVFGYKFYLLQHAPEESNEWKHGDEQPVTVTSGRPVHGETNRTMHENGSRL